MVRSEKLFIKFKCQQGKVRDCNKAGQANEFHHLDSNKGRTETAVLWAELQHWYYRNSPWVTGNKNEEMKLKAAEAAQHGTSYNCKISYAKSHLPSKKRQFFSADLYLELLYRVTAILSWWPTKHIKSHLTHSLTLLTQDKCIKYRGNSYP